MKGLSKIEDIVFAEIINMSESDLNSALLEAGLSPDEQTRNFDAALAEASLTFRKARLSKEQLQISKGTQESTTSSVLRFAGSALEQLKTLAKKGNAPEGITLAFREGKSISEEEAKQIIDDLSELGYFDNEK